jgi:hypothetical protein
MIKSMAFLEMITLCCDPSGGLHGTQDRVNQHLRRKFILTCLASNSDIPRNVHVLITHPFAERCLRLPLSLIHRESQAISFAMFWSWLSAILCQW